MAPLLPLSQAVSRTGEVGPCSRSLVDAVSGPVSQPSPGWGCGGKSFKSGSVNLDVLSQEEERRNPSLTLVLSCVLQYRSPEATVGVVCYEAASNARVSIPICRSVLCGHAQLVRTQKGGRSESYISYVLLPPQS